MTFKLVSKPVLDERANIVTQLLLVKRGTMALV